jgi:hypothetical protein
MQDWPALVSKRGVNAVVDEVAVAVGDEDTEDEIFTGGGDGLELEDAAGGLLEYVLMAFESLQDPATVREHRRGCYQVGFLEFAGLVLHLQLIQYARMRPDDFRDLTCGVGVANGDAWKGIFEGFVSNPRTLEKGGKHAISLPRCGCLKWGGPCEGLANGYALEKRDCGYGVKRGNNNAAWRQRYCNKFFCRTPTFSDI